MGKEDESGGWPQPAPSGANEQVAFFEAAGLSPVAAAALADIDRTMQRIRRGIGRREAMNAVLKAMDPNVDPGHLDVISVLMGNNQSPEIEITVGFVGEKLGVDPSRASRLVGEVVDLGYVRRVASQADSRRICLELTGRGGKLARDFHERKWTSMAKGMQGWTDEEVLTFSRLLDRYANWAKSAQSQEREAVERARREPAAD
jgi:DNA-binding MarR family transcriptional regulator